MVTLLNQDRPSLRLLNDLTCCLLCEVVAWSCLELEPTLLRSLEASRSQADLTMFTHSLIHSFIKFSFLHTSVYGFRGLLFGLLEYIGISFFAPKQQNGNDRRRFSRNI